MSGVGTLPICRHGMRVIKPEPESGSSSVTGSVRHSTLVQKKRGNISIMKSMKLMFCTFLVISCQIFSSFPLPTNVLRNPCAESHLKNKVFFIYNVCFQYVIFYHNITRQLLSLQKAQGKNLKVSTLNHTCVLKE